MIDTEKVMIDKQVSNMNNDQLSIALYTLLDTDKGLPVYNSYYIDKVTKEAAKRLKSLTLKN